MRQFNISVIGLSGTEKDRGQVGVGKSCLCNRFMRPMADDYFIDHISVLSQSDFSGRIVNNDHFLYWGEVRKTTDEGVEYNFNIIEQTEFMDDSTFQAFKVGKMDPYSKRCTATKVFSAEKLMYICKNQLGIEKEYEQKVMPDGRLSIDGFVVVFDVSPVPNRSVEKQVEFVQNVIANILKNKKPLVLVTTKNDDAYELYVREAEKISQRKDYKSTVQLIETSAHESINIDMAFLMLAQMIDKVKNRVKIISYQESAKSRKELLDIRSEAVTRLIRNQITDYHILWSQGSKMLSQYREWNEFLNIFGHEAGQKLFRRHMKKLRDDHLNKKLHQYLDKFALALEYLLPDISALNISDDDAWECARNYLQTHIEFEQYFFECPQATWTELLDMDEAEDESRIPFDVLETNEAETVFRNYLNSVQQDKKKIGWKQQFKMLLEESGFVTPGKQLSEVRVLFMGRECFEALSEHDCQQIYDIHQDEIIEKSKQNFVELLLEHAQYFLQFKNVDIITQEDVRQITDVIQEDSRYKMLDRLDQERRVMLVQHLRFIHCPIRDHCPFFNNCVDNLIEEVLSDKSAGNHKSHGGGPVVVGGGWKTTGNGSDRTLNLLIVGSEHLASDLLNDIRICTGSKGEYIYENQTYYLNYRIANGDMEAFKAIDVYSSGLICVYSNQQSFETLKDNLERTLLCNLELEDKFENLPIVLVYQPQDLKENEVEYLRSEGMRLSEMLHCDFIDHTQNHQKYVYDILNIVILSLKLSEMKSYEPYPSSNHTDLRILVCIYCGDQYDIENIVQPLIAESTMVKANEHCIIVDVFIGDAKRRVEFILSSYHGTNQYRDELIHGYIYIYSAKRRSSLANLNILAAQNANIPLQIVAVTESGGVNAFFNNEICQFLITEGNALADRFKGSFMTFSADQYVKFAFYNPFLKTAWDNKYEVENLHVEESITLDSGEGTLENSVNQMPRPPPRHESYMLSNTLGTDGSGSENYEMLPTRSLNSLNEERDISLDEIYDDNNEKPKHLHQKWLEDKNDPRRNMNKNSIWNNFSGSTHAYTTGRRHIDSNLNKIRPKGPSQTLKVGEAPSRNNCAMSSSTFTLPTQQPGKLNMKNFQLVSDAVAKMNFSSSGSGSMAESYLAGCDGGGEKDAKRYDHAQLDGEDEDSEELAEYEQIYENEDCTESDSCASSTERRVRQQNAYYKANKKAATTKKNKKKKVAIPVQTPRVPPFGAYVSPPEIPSHYQRMAAVAAAGEKKKAEAGVIPDFMKSDKSPEYSMVPELTAAGIFGAENLPEFNMNAKCLKDFEKLEKRRIKEETARLRKLQEKEKEQEKKLKRKLKQNAKGLTETTEAQFGKLMITSDKDEIPIFLIKCVEFIEKEGLDSEGIYRVPGSRAHVDMLFQRFEEDTNTIIDVLDIPVNAVATALKDFFSKRLPPLFSKDIIKELEEIAGSRGVGSSKLNVEVKTDRSCRLIALKSLLQKLPPINFAILKYIFQHFVHVSDNSKLNSMDSKNLAICWWPTLIPIDFTDMGHFEQLRPYLEDIVQTMIDQFPYLFCGKDAFVMV
ncbi:rho GTPase-activating protein 190 isoform X1 [Drosophila innubila]|uniref:rho GTPase-activating protein 190 isoform X1 n=1 Tax=Drosophila innubila TaxID=198719 RepID=UPI00148D9DBE|nr:rho GTPase-activating protein 190 isoform X1 [Drosophila innubila]XP_034490076.1 rho GTPase-activating protein 190 isoform X1 [Drosophila innubila]